MEHVPDPEEEAPQDAADLGPDLHAPDLAQQRVERTSEPAQSVLLQPRQLREQQQQHRGPGVAVRLAGQGQKVGDNL